MFGRSRPLVDRLGAQIVAMLLLVVAMLLLGAFPRPAHAEDASPWARDMHSAVRLIAAGASHDKGRPVLRAGIEIRLDPGWKTYWRYPGDSGVPPRFVFTRSENIQSVTVKWPAPNRFTDESGQSIGYHDRVIFPLVIVPKDASRPVRLRADLDYAVCEKLCIPAEGKVDLVADGKPTGQEAALTAAEARVPRRRSLGEPSALSLSGVTRESGRIVVDVAARADKVELFAEGPSPEWALPLPEPVAGAPAGLKRFAFALDGLPPGASPDGAVLTLTAITDDEAIEVEWPIK